MRTRLKTHIHRGFGEQRTVFRSHIFQRVHLGMPLSRANVVAFAENARVAALTMHDHRPHHRVGSRGEFAVSRQFEAASHPKFVCVHECLRAMRFFAATTRRADG